MREILYIFWLNLLLAKKMFFIFIIIIVLYNSHNIKYEEPQNNLNIKAVPTMLLAC